MNGTIEIKTQLQKEGPHSTHRDIPEHPAQDIKETANEEENKPFLSESPVGMMEKRQA